MDAYPHPGAMKTMVMHSDFDLLSSLDSLLHKFPTKPNIQWVASHQDNDTKDISTLSLAAQLNIHADELETIGLQRLLLAPFAPMDSATFVQLHHCHGTITQNITHDMVCQLCQLTAKKKKIF